jgi:hypothetical protein
MHSTFEQSGVEIDPSGDWRVALLGGLIKELGVKPPTRDKSNTYFMLLFKLEITIRDRIMGVVWGKMNPLEVFESFRTPKCTYLRETVSFEYRLSKSAEPFLLGAVTRNEQEFYD